MSQAEKTLRVQLMRGESRWGARLAEQPDVLFIGRSCAEALGKLVIAMKSPLGLTLSAYAGESKRHVPTSEPAQGAYKLAMLQEIIAEGSLPPLWTTGPRGREHYFKWQEIRAEVEATEER